MVVLLALQLCRNWMARSHADIAWIAVVLHDHSGQESQGERMVTIWLACRLNLGPRASHTLCVEEVHSIIRVERRQGFTPAAGESIEFSRMQTTGDQHAATHWSGCDPPQKVPGTRVDATPDVPTPLEFVSLVSGVQPGVDPQLTFETVKDEQEASLRQQVHQRF